MKKNVASQIVGCELISKTDGSAVTTGTTTVYVTGDNGTQAAGSVGSGACTHKGNGCWTYAPAQAETNYDNIQFTFVNTAACNVTVQIYPSFPQTGDNYGRIGAPSGASIAADIAAAKVDTAAIKVQTDKMVFTVAGYLDVNAYKWVGGTIPAVNVTGVPLVDMKYVLGTVSPAAAGYVALDWGQITNKTTTNALTGTTISTAQVAASVTAAVTLTSGERNSVADALLARNIAGGSSSGRIVTDAFRALRNKQEISGGTYTVYQEDDTTSAWTAAVTTAAGNPLSSIDPA